MRRNAYRILCWIGALWMVSNGSIGVRAEDAPQPSTESTAVPATEATTPVPPAQIEADSDAEPPPKPVARPAKKGRRPVEKETEGTQAPNRFQADTVIKSQYQLHGEQLEVDPD